MKILIIMMGFFPGQKYGGPPVSVDNFCTLMDDCECYIVTRNHDMGDTEPYKNIKKGWNDRGNCQVLYLSDKEYGYKKYQEIIEEIKPDILYLQGMFQNCIVPCLILAKKFNLPVLLAPRGELCEGAFKKKYKKIPYIMVLKILGLLRNIHFQSTSEEETESIIKRLSASQDKIHFLTNIPSIPKKDYPIPEKEPGIAKFVFISRIVRKKNLKAALSYFREIEGDVTFDIYGPIEDNEYWQECQEEIKQLPNNVKVNYCGLVSHENIHETFAKYHAFIFPTFSENFGHVIAEALSVGCPVIISDQTPWNSINFNDGFIGRAIEISNKQLFINTIRNIVSMEENVYQQVHKNTIEYINKKIQKSALHKQYVEKLRYYKKGDIYNE